MYPHPVVIVTYKGKPLSRKAFDEMPEIHTLYPSGEVFMQELYLPLLQKSQETGLEQVLEISEQAISINGTPYTLK